MQLSVKCRSRGGSSSVAQKAGLRSCTLVVEVEDGLVGSVSCLQQMEGESEEARRAKDKVFVETEPRIVLKPNLRIREPCERYGE